MTSSPIPISLTLGELQSFIEIPFEHDEPLYAVEFQLFDFAGTTGYAAKVQDWSKRVWLYFEPHLPITPEWFARDPAYSLAELGELIPTEFERIHYEITSTSVELDAVFVDRHGKRNQARVSSSGERPAPSIFTPTPPGVHPANLRLLHMNGFRFLRTDRSKISFTVGGTPLAPAKLRVPGFPLDIKRLWSTRVCTGLTLAAVNGDRTPVESTRVENDHGWFQARGGPEFGPMSGRGTFTIEMPLGAGSSGQWLLRSFNDDDGPGFAAELTGVTQNWRPSIQRPLQIGLWIIRRIRRRNESWSWSGVFGRDQSNPNGWTRVGQWTH
jgi:hypothetical protein